LKHTMNRAPLKKSSIGGDPMVTTMPHDVTLTRTPSSLRQVQGRSKVVGGTSTSLRCRSLVALGVAGGCRFLREVKEDLFEKCLRQSVVGHTPVEFSTFVRRLFKGGENAG